MVIASRRRSRSAARLRALRVEAALVRARPGGRVRAWLDVPGRPFVAVASAIGLIALALLRVPIGVRPTYLGVSYAQLAADPFHPDPANPVAHRILTPLVSWALGFRGPFLLYTDLLAVVAFLALVFLWLRTRGLGTLSALAGTATMAFSSAALTTLHYGGYTDTVTYLLLLLALWSARRPWLAACCFLLALANHEGAAFLAPWLALVIAAARPYAPHRRRDAVLAVTVALAGYAALVWALQLAHPGGATFSAAYYLKPLLADPLRWFRASAPHRALGVFAAFHLFWVLPPLAAWHRWRAGGRTRALVILLPIPLALAQLFVAYDVTRVATLAFAAVLIAAADLLLANAFLARRWMPLLAAAGLLAPHLNVAMGVVDAMGH